MAANKNLPVMIIGAGAIIGLIMLLSGKSGSNNAATPATNPDPVNHPNAVLVNGVWRDATHFFNPNTLVWSPISTSTGIIGAFDLIMPENGGFGVTNYYRIMLRMTSNYDKFNVGDNVLVSHLDYNQKRGSVTSKINGEDGNKYMVVSVPWNFVSNNLVTGFYNTPINTVGGSVTKL